MRLSCAGSKRAGHRAWRAALAVLLWAGCAGMVWGAEPKPAGVVTSGGELIRGAEDVSFVEITAGLRGSVDRGLSYLASRQTGGGGFVGPQGAHGVAITSLACLAFMADGNLPERGPYAKEVERGLEYVLRNVQGTGLIASDQHAGPMYGHGFATLFLGEFYGMTGDERVRDALVKAVRLIVQTQNSEGGWRYQPAPVDADISVTICQIMALRSARNAGLSVPKQTIDRAITYVRQCQNQSDGGFKYMMRGPGESAFPRSAAGVASLYYAGIYDDDAVRRGLAYLQGQGVQDPRMIGHYFYGHYYAVQAMYLAGGEYWARWFPMIRSELLAKQETDGHWDSDYGTEYGTAMALIILQMPNRYLPIVQR